MVVSRKPLELVDASFEPSMLTREPSASAPVATLIRWVPSIESGFEMSIVPVSWMGLETVVEKATPAEPPTIVAELASATAWASEPAPVAAVPVTAKVTMPVVS